MALELLYMDKVSAVKIFHVFNFRCIQLLSVKVPTKIYLPRKFDNMRHGHRGQKKLCVHGCHVAATFQLYKHYFASERATEQS